MVGFRKVIRGIVAIWAVLTAYLLIYGPPNALTEFVYQDDPERAHVAALFGTNKVLIELAKESKNDTDLNDAIEGMQRASNRMLLMYKDFANRFMAAYWRFSLLLFISLGVLYWLESSNTRDSIMGKLDDYLRNRKSS